MPFRVLADFGVPEMEYIRYNTGTRALPDIYALALAQTLCVYIRQSTLACVITYTYITQARVL